LPLGSAKNDESSFLIFETASLNDIDKKFAKTEIKTTFVKRLLIKKTIRNLWISKK